MPSLSSSKQLDKEQLAFLKRSYHRGRHGGRGPTPQLPQLEFEVR